MNLASQFRCNGSDGYLAWLDNVLDIRDTANDDLSELNYDFRVVDSPKLLHSIIKENNLINNKYGFVFITDITNRLQKAINRFHQIHVASYRFNNHPCNFSTKLCKTFF